MNYSLVKNLQIIPQLKLTSSMGKITDYSLAKNLQIITQLKLTTSMSKNNRLFQAKLNTSCVK
jgi:hypothetical protein